MIFKKLFSFSHIFLILLFSTFMNVNGAEQYFGETQILINNSTRWGNDTTILSFGGYSFESKTNINDVEVYPGFNNELRRFTGGYSKKITFYKLS